MIGKFFKNNIQVLSDGEWSTFFRTKDEKESYITFDVVANKGEYLEDYPKLILIRISQKEKVGFSSKEFIELNKLEDRIAENLQNKRVDVKLVARYTSGARRYLVIYSKKTEIGKAKEVLTDFYSDSFDISINESSEGWAYWNKIIRPNGMDQNQINDMQAFLRLLSAGTDPQKLHNIESFVYGDDEKLSEFKLKIQKSKKFIQTKNIEGGVKVTFEVVLDFRKLNKITSEVYKITEDLGLKYDGWGAAIHR